MTNALKTLILFIILTAFNVSAQIPIDSIKKRVVQLRTEQGFDDFWDEMHGLDQNILVHIQDPGQYDSLSIQLMISTALVYENHGIDAIGKYNFVPILNFVHCKLYKANFHFWPIILELTKIGGYIEDFGGGFPRYQLEHFGLSSYNYSFFRQDTWFPALLEKLSIQPNVLISDKLIDVFNENKRIRALKEIETLGSWRNQAFKNQPEEDVFQLVRLSDNNLYFKNRNKLIKVKMKKTSILSTKLELEIAVFGFYYRLNKFNKLALYDANGNVLIRYKKAK
jgi:hypothetical protein